VNPDSALPDADPEDSGRIAGYRVSGGPTAASPSVLNRLRSFFLADASYRDAHEKEGIISLCAFAPGVALRFSQGTHEPFDILICFRCTELAYRMPSGLSSRAGFQPGRRNLLKILTAALPADEELQTLLKPH
jgi:hypothetical protein